MCVYHNLYLESIIPQNFKIFNKDTCDDDFENDKETKLAEFMEEMSTKKLVVTDRLHGMILAYITKTPCIVFENSNHKIRSTYETWLKSKKEILLINKFNSDEINKFIEQLENEMTYLSMDEKYTELKKAIKEG